MSINGLEWVVLAVLALALVGPNRLPEYATGLARLIRRAREFALGAREQVRTELGPEFDDVDWRKYDPRRYHPRQIVRNALSETWEDPDDEPPVKPVSATMSTAKVAGATIAPTSSPSLTKPPAVAATPVRSGATAASRPGGSVRGGSAPRPARTPRPAVLDGAPGPSPAPSTWASRATEVTPSGGYDSDAT